MSHILQCVHAIASLSPIINDHYNITIRSASTNKVYYPNIVHIMHQCRYFSCSVGIYACSRVINIASKNLIFFCMFPLKLVNRVRQKVKKKINENVNSRPPSFESSSLQLLSQHSLRVASDCEHIFFIYRGHSCISDNSIKTTGLYFIGHETNTTQQINATVFHTH